MCWLVGSSEPLICQSLLQKLPWLAEDPAGSDGRSRAARESSGNPCPSSIVSRSVTAYVSVCPKTQWLKHLFMTYLWPNFVTQQIGQGSAGQFFCWAPVGSSMQLEVSGHTHVYGFCKLLAGNPTSPPKPAMWGFFPCFPGAVKKKMSSTG